MSDMNTRRLALDPARSILLQAPAGSGKTTVLGQRFLGLLAIVDEPEEVLAITFTRKAAAEMRERVLAALEGHHDSGPAGAVWADLRSAVLAHATRRNWPLADLGARLRIQTIDSLNHEIARAMPVLGRSQGSLQVVDDASALYQEAARRTLRRMDAEATLQADADVLLDRLDNNLRRAGELIADLLNARASWLPIMLGNHPERLAPAVTESLERIIGESLDEAQQIIPPPLLAEAEQLLRASAQHRQDAAHAPSGWEIWLDPQTGFVADAEGLPAWRAMVDLLLTAAGTLRKQINVSAGFPPAERALKEQWRSWKEEVAGIADIEALLTRLRDLPPAELGQSDSAAMAALARILIRAATELLLVFQERGSVDHTQVAATARQALVAESLPTDLAIRHTLTIRHLLVDEFQDVSPQQVDLIASLTAGWSRGDGRSLFLVGDPMQSIYLFRHSEVGLFLRTRRHGIGGLPLEPMQLTRNFRSRPELVRWANEVFAASFPRRENIRTSAVGFLPSEAARSQQQDAAVQIWPLPEDDASSEARWIAARIAESRADSPASRIAVLLRDRRLAPPMLKALRDAGIPVRGLDLASLAQHQTVLDLVALGSALLHAGDRVAWLAVLRSPACGLALADLAALAAEDPAVPLVARLAEPALWSGVSADGQARLQRVAPLLVAAWRNRQRAPLSDAIETLWRELGGEMLCAPAQRHVGMQYLTALRRLHREDPSVDGRALAQLAGRLRDTPMPGEPGESPPVEVLTIHHAKGLEWDVVFVPGIGRAAPPGRTPLMRWLELPSEDERQDLLMAVHSIGEPPESDALSAYIRGLQQERERNEQLRLAYVAFTRARERLVLTGWARRDADTGETRPLARSILAHLWQALRPAFECANAPQPQADAIDAAPPAAALQPLTRSRADMDPHAHRQALLPRHGMEEGSAEIAERPEFAWVGPRARAEGTVVHAMLDGIARSGGWERLAAPEAQAMASRQLRQLGLPETEAQASASQVMSRLLALRDDPRARWLLSPAHREAHCELRLSGPVDGRVRNIIIDRSFIDENGQRWVVDYKTSTHAGSGLGAFLANELERYRPQLELYRQMAARLGPEPVRAALYFPWLREWVELDHSPAMENG